MRTNNTIPFLSVLCLSFAVLPSSVGLFAFCFADLCRDAVIDIDAQALAQYNNVDVGKEYPTVGLNALSHIAYTNNGK